MQPHVVTLPIEARRGIAAALRSHARALLYGKSPSTRDIQHAERLRCYADLIFPREAAGNDGRRNP